MTFEEVACTKETHGTGESRLLCMDALQSLPALAELAGRVRCVYIDPPFRTGKRFDRRVSTGAEALSLPGYVDRMEQDEHLHLLHGLLCTARSLLAPDGGLCLHLDWRTSAYGRLLCDSVFGPDAFLNEVIWAYNSGGRSVHHFSRKHDTILLYGAGSSPRFDVARAATGETGGRRGHLKQGVDEAGRPCRTIRSGGKEYRYYDDAPCIPTDVWTDISHLQQRDPERTGWPTQKPVRLLQRLLRPFCLPGEWCADLCCGSGTTLAAARAEGLRFLGVDRSPAACAVARGRLLGASFTAEIPCAPAPAALMGEMDGGILRLRDYRRDGAATSRGLGEVAQLSLGALAGDSFVAQTDLHRPHGDEPWLCALPLPVGDAPALLLVDDFGGKHIYRLRA